MKRLLILIAFLPTIAGASASNDLEKLLAKKTEFVPCATGPLAGREAFSAFVSEILRVGVSRIEKVNGALISERLRRSSKRGLKITCAQPLEGSEADTTPGILWKATLIRLGEALGRPDSFDVPSIVFHEFLHAIGFDNIPAKIHNDASKLALLDRHGYSIRERDLVYACAVVAFPDGIYYFSPPMNLDRAAKTCAEGRVVDGRVVRYDPRRVK